MFIELEELEELKEKVYHIHFSQKMKINMQKI